MPFVALSTKKDDVNIFWRSNLPNDDLATLASSSRPTLLILNCVMMPIEFLDGQFDDPMLSERYNILAFDAPGHGATECALLNTRDQICRLDDWALAGLVGDFCLALSLPPVHVLACGPISTHAAVRFALLFPELCRSLVLIGISDYYDDPQFREAILSMADILVESTDPELLEQCAKQFFYLMFGEAQMDKADEERYLGHLMDRWDPKYQVTTLHTGWHMLKRPPLHPDQTQRLTCPIALLQPTLASWLTVRMAHDFAALFPNAPGGAQVEVFPGGACGMLFIEPGLVNRRVLRCVDEAQLAGSLSTSTSTPKQASIARKEGMRLALGRLAEIAGKQSELAGRDSGSIFSFSLRAEDVVDDMNRTLLSPYLDMISKQSLA